jgi:phasin family protein
LEKAFSRHSLADASFVKALSLTHRERETPGDAMSTDPMQKFGKESMDMAMKAFGVWSKNTQAIASEVADYSKKSFEDSALAFQKLIGAKSLEKAMEVQTEYLQSSYEELVAETAKIGELYADLAREAYKPLESVLMKMPGVGAK